MTYDYKLGLCYKGSSYKGWQSQKGPESTIQDTLNKTLHQIFKSQNIKTYAAGRTDAGVHALEQLVKLEAPFYIKSNNLKKALNGLLPSSIRVFKSEFFESGLSSFMPTVDAKSRTYRYYFSNFEVENPIFSDLVLNYPMKLDINKMKASANIFEGLHDFVDFSCRGTDVKSTIRNIESCKIKESKNNFDGLMKHVYYLEVTGNGFLKQMVRGIMGSLFEVGRGKKDVSDITSSLNKPSGVCSFYIAPAKGLIKYAIEY